MDVKYDIGMEEVVIDDGVNGRLRVYHNGEDLDALDTPYRIFCSAIDGYTRMRLTRNDLLDFIDKVKIMVEDIDEKENITND